MLSKELARLVCHQRRIFISGKSVKNPNPLNSNQPSFLQKMDQKLESELMFTREVLCAMIHRAVLDAQLTPDKYMRQHTKNMNEKFQQDALHFIRSEGFKDICNALGLPSDKLKRIAFV
jgi:hypothetical protein